MRRIVSACLLQTMRFDVTHDADPKRDYEIYCNKLKKEGTKLFIEETRTEPDGSLIVKIKKQYNSYKTDGYLD